ncbi:MAG: tRNA (5-methylaminomethyl-2-thiouridine)(34)-methyltransferase MnmD [Saprospiraceae bacterium]|nr:tRNA (5-methylaminomethyl-2-thiouridine)(34)-methyltransferase MnmD [Saprospiraceae bacterium]
MRPLDQSIHASKDGSHTAYSAKYNAHYHSIYGALEESIHVFISAGLFYLQRKERRTISILEMGFGTGLNALLTLIEAKRFNLNIAYQTVETDPFDKALVDKLNYTEILNLQPELVNQFHQMHACSWNEDHKLNDRFAFKKHLADIRELALQEYTYDLVYFDAFAPSCQSYLWEEELHEKIYKSLNKGGVLVTYCTQGAFKRHLKNLGYKLDILNGPAKKREMVRAVKA